MELKFAFAVNTSRYFKNNHFGNADKYLIYKVESNKLRLVTEEENNFKQLDKGKEHGLRNKGNAIIQFLKEKEVNVLVAMQFGENIKMINQHFVPVIIYQNDPQKVIGIINKHLHWIIDEWDHKAADYNLFMIKNGILKSRVK